MGTKILLLICLTTHISGEVHHPRVHEDEVEHGYNGNENIRTVRNPENTYRTVHRPPVFSYDAAKQQDYLRHRYAQQQQVDLRMSNRYPKTHLFSNVPAIFANQAFSRVQRSKNNPQEWQPFSPSLSKQSVHPIQQRIITDEPKNNKISSESVALEDLDTEGSEIVEDKLKIDRQDSQTSHGQAIYTNPNLIEPDFEKNSQKQTIGNYEPTVKKPDTELRVLNELIGKNPNVQLEGLKRLIQETPNENFLTPIVRGPQPFQVTDRTSISEKNLADNSISTPQIPQIVDKESFADLQKQFDEASRLQTEQVLARAQQQAQAHVEAQHKAIALAQVHAQKTILENFKKSLYGNTPTLPHAQTYAPQAIAFVRAQPRPSPVATNNAVSYASHGQNQPLPEKQHDNRVNDHPQASTYTEVINLPPANLGSTDTYSTIPQQAYDSKNSLYYAPSHQHQHGAAEAQAAGVQLVQVPEHTSAILQANSETLNDHQTLDAGGAGYDIEDDGIAGINSLAQSAPSASAYQHINLESNPLEHEGHDDIDEVSVSIKRSEINLNLMFKSSGISYITQLLGRYCPKCRHEYFQNCSGEKHFIKKRNVEATTPESDYYDYYDDDVDTNVDDESKLSKQTDTKFENIVRQGSSYADFLHQTTTEPFEPVDASPEASRRLYRYPYSYKHVRQRYVPNYFHKSHNPHYHSYHRQKPPYQDLIFTPLTEVKNFLPNRKDDLPNNVLVINNNNQLFKPQESFHRKVNGYKKRRYRRKHHSHYRPPSEAKLKYIEHNIDKMLAKIKFFQ